MPVRRPDTPDLVLVLTALGGLVVTTLLASAAEEVYDGVVDSDGVAGLDQPVLDAAVRMRSPGLDRVVAAYTDLGGPVGMTVLAVLAVAALTWLRRSRTPVVLMLVAVAGSLTLTTLGKDLVGRVRPPRSLAVAPYESSPSFPSGHTLNATVVAGVVVYLLLPILARPVTRLAAVAVGVVFAVTMGLSRVYLGHHWLSDVVMGWLLGLAWLAVVVTAHRVSARPRGGRRPSGRPPRGSRAAGSRG